MVKLKGSSQSSQVKGVKRKWSSKRGGHWSGVRGNMKGVASEKVVMNQSGQVVRP